MRIAARASLIALLVLHVLAAMAGFVAPYDPTRQHRQHQWAPPTPLRIEGLRLVAYGRDDGGALTRYPVKLFPRGHDGRRLFGAGEPGKVFLMGTDGLGRDQFSRWIYGARTSLFSGLAAALLSAILGAGLGLAAGFYGGRADRLTMRAAELFLALPWMYLLLAMRAFFPLNADPRTLFLALLALLGAIGWARPARLVRGIVLSAKEREFVLAARGFGAPDSYLIWHHIAPATIPTLATYLSLAIPQYVLAEASLSFLGLGLGGSVPSWGSLLASLSQIEVLESYWWMTLPAAGFALVFGCYNELARGLRIGMPAP